MADLEKVANVAAVVNQSALGWYGTITGKPISTGAPTSWMQTAVGTDLRGGPTVLGQTASPLSVIAVLAILVIGGVLIVRKL